MDDEDIRVRAHQIWEREGRPSGRDREHWELARQQLVIEEEALMRALIPARARLYGELRR